MIQPDYRTFCRLARQGNLVPVYDTVTTDLLTPVSAYLRMARDARYAFLLESVEGGEKIARYTFLGANPLEIFRYTRGACIIEGQGRLHWEQANPIEFLRHRIARYRPERRREGTRRLVACDCDPLGKPRDGRRLEQAAQRYFDIEDLSHLCDHLRRQQ